MNYSWPGNVRELKNAIDHAFVTVSGNCLTLLDLPPEVRLPPSQTPSGKPASLITPQEEAERTRILEALQKAKGSKTNTAKLLGISRVTLWKKLHRLGIHPINN